MCQSVLISNNITRLSTRSYNHRLEVVTPTRYSVAQLSRLNRDLNNLYELIYDQWRTVTEDDYKQFGGQFKLLLEMLKGLYQSVKKLPKSMGFATEAENLEMNYAALYEVNSDIVNFCIKLPKNERFQKAMVEASQHLNA